MDTQEIISEIIRLPLAEQQQVLATVSANLKQTEISDAERLEQIVLERLLAKGVIGEIPPHWDSDDTFEPVEIEGEPLSEMIIRERR